jgi:hypothetical protein
MFTPNKSLAIKNFLSKYFKVVTYKSLSTVLAIVTTLLIQIKEAAAVTRFAIAAAPKIPRSPNKRDPSNARGT